MGLLQNIFGKKQSPALVTNEYFKTLTAYQPVFTSFDGSLYEMELVRSAIHTHATFSAKLKPVVSGADPLNIGRMLGFKPNKYMDTYKFIYRLRTILEMQNTAFIVPILNDFEDIVGYYPVLPTRCEILTYKGEEFLRYTFSNGQKAVVEFDRVGILTKFQYKDDFFGESNRALNPTANLIHTQNQGIIEGVKNSATVRFMGRLANTYKPEDIEKQRKNFREANLSTDNNGGIVIVDNKFVELKQIESKPYNVDADQMKLIQENVFKYFNINEKIIRNEYNEDEWNAYYEGAIEPFAIQLSLVMTNMTFTSNQRTRGSEILFTANRLQYASNTTKMNIITQLFDRGMLSRDEGREIMNMSPIGDNEYYIRLEYGKVGEKDEGKETNDDDDEG